MKKFKIITLGCKVNQYESEAMEELFKNKGYEKSLDDKADVYVINTCAVTGQAAAKSRQAVSKARKKNPGAKIAVVGCYSQVSPDEVSALEGVDIIVGTKHRNKILDLLDEAESTNEKLNIVDNIKNNQNFDEIDYTSLNRSMTRAYIKIQEGCNMFCSYCIIPYARGPISSRRLENIVEETGELAGKGYKEIILTGIHVESYGKDLGKDYARLIDVVEECAKIEGIERIRLSSIEPRAISHDFLQRYKATKKACDHFHLSLQSGSNTILKAMNRKYSREEYKEKVDLIREYFPDAGITTDVIVGFPGESEELFRETMDFINTIEFSKIHVFPFSPRKGTPAADFEGQVEGNIKKHRVHELSAAEEKIHEKFLDGFIGRELDVLIELETENERYSSGYSNNYLRVNVQRDYDLVNQIVKVKILEREGEELKGLVIGG